MFKKTKKKECTFLHIDCMICKIETCLICFNNARTVKRKYLVDNIDEIDNEFLRDNQKEIFLCQMCFKNYNKN